METPQDNLLDILKVLFRWKKPIIAVTSLAAIGAVLICLSLPNYYKATTKFYPANPSISDPEAMFANGEQMRYFGGDDEADRLISAATSQAVIGKIITEFNLYEHYNVDKNEEKARFKVEKKLFKLYKVIKNEYGAIELSVEDKDRMFAAKVANTVRDYSEATSKILTNQTKGKILSTIEKLLNNKNKEIRILSDSLMMLRRKYNIYDIKSQSELYAKLVPGTEAQLAEAKARLQSFQQSGGFSQDSITYLKARIRGLKEKKKLLTSKGEGATFSVAQFNEGREKVSLLESNIESMTGELGGLNERYYSYKSAVEADIPTIFVEELAFPPEVKSRPVRSLIVLSATFIAFILSVLGALLFDTYKEVNWKEIVNAG